MNMKAILLALLGAGLVILAGCSSGTSEDTKTSGLFGSGSSFSSVGGVDLEFAPNNPPASMFKDSAYTFAFVFKNYQEHPVSDLIVKTRGFDRNYVTGLDEQYSAAKIDAYTTQSGPGISQSLVVSGVTVTGFTKSYNFDPSFDYCYSAQSTYIEQICVPSKKDNACAGVTVDKKSKKTNGPVAITFSRISSLPSGQVIAEFSLANNAGRGKVVKQCFDTTTYQVPYTIEVTLGTVKGVCKSTGSEDFLMYNEKALFSCTFDRSSEDAYASQISAKMTYKYQQSLSKKITVTAMQ